MDINQISKLLIALVVVLSILVLIAYCVKKFKGHHYLGGKNIKVVCNLLVGQKERIVLLEVEGQKALIGVTAHAIHTLMLLNRPITEASFVNNGHHEHFHTS